MPGKKDPPTAHVIGEEAFKMLMTTLSEFSEAQAQHVQMLDAAAKREDLLLESLDNATKNINQLCKLLQDLYNMQRAYIEGHGLIPEGGRGAMKKTRRQEEQVYLG